MTVWILALLFLVLWIHHEGYCRLLGFCSYTFLARQNISIPILRRSIALLIA